MPKAATPARAPADDQRGWLDGVTDVLRLSDEVCRVGGVELLAGLRVDLGYERRQLVDCSAWVAVVQVLDGAAQQGQQ